MPFEGTPDESTGSLPARIALVTGTADPLIVSAQQALAAHGMEVTLVELGAGIEEKITTFAPNCLVLDLRAGVEAQQLASWCTRQVASPLIVITKPEDVMARIHAVELGAADHLILPFAVAELLARVRAVLTRPASEGRTRLEFGDLVIDPARRVATRAGRTIPLTGRELAVLLVLVRHRARIVSKEELLREVWGDDHRPTANTVEATISSLRRKLDTHAPSLIHTVHRSGYSFEPPESSRGTRATLIAERDRLIRERDETIAHRDDVIRRLRAQIETARRSVKPLDPGRKRVDDDVDE